MRNSTPSALIRRNGIAVYVLGFSLLELMVVMAIMGVVAGLSVFGFISISRSQGVSQAVYDISGLLQFARSEAVTRQTYVWVGFQTANTGNSSQIIAAAVASIDGSGTNTAQTNLSILSRVIHIKKVSLISWPALSASTQAAAAGILPTGAFVDSVTTNTSGIAFSSGSVSFPSGSTVTFTPRGEAMLKGAVSYTDGYNPYMDISLKQSLVAAGSPTDASVLINGATGTLKIIRTK